MESDVAEDRAGELESVFVGRERELRALEAALRAAAAGRSRLVTLVGEPGIGKTRTAEELLRRARLGPEEVLWGRCSEHEGAPAYWPWIQVIRRYAERCDDAALRALLGSGAAEIGRLVSAVRTRLPDLEIGPARDPEGTRFELFDAVAGLLRRAAARTPLVVILEDLHWADEGSIALLTFLASELRGAPVLLLATYRERGVRRPARGLADLARLGQRFALAGLPRGDVERLLRASMPQAPSAELIEEIHRLTEGNPMFLDEVARVLRLEGPAEGAGIASLHLPDGIREAIRRRMDPLSAAERELLTLAAVVGREFDLRTLEAATGTPAAELLETLAAATALGLLEEAEPVGRFRFAHALIRETLYGDLLPSHRVRLHHRVGRALEALFAGSPEAPAAELAYHFFQAAPVCDGDEPVRYAAEAGAGAFALLAYRDAVGHYERALAALAMRAPDEPRKLALQLALGDAGWRAGEGPKAREAFERAARIARALGDAGGLARAAVSAMRVVDQTGAVDPKLVALLEESLDALPADDSPLRARVLAGLAAALYFSREEARRLALTEEAVEMARRTGEPRALCGALIAHHVNLVGSTRFAERTAIGEAVVEATARAGDDYEKLIARACRIFDLLEAGDVATAEREVERFALAAEESRFIGRLWQARVLRAALALLAGRFDDGARFAGEALGRRQGAQNPAIAQVYYLQMYAHHREVGGLAEIEPLIAAFARDFVAIPAWRCTLAVVQMEMGREPAVRALLEPLAARDFADLPQDVNLAGALAALAEVVAWLGDARRAGQLYERLLPFRGRHIVVTATAAVILGAASRYLGLLAAARGERATAIALFEEALAENARSGARPQFAHTQVDLAALLLRGGAGERERAGALLAEARATASELGMRPLRERVDQLAARPAGEEVAPQASATPAPAAASTPVAALRRNGEVWTVAYEGASFLLKDSKGLAVLAHLLRHPGREFHVLDLAGAAAAAPEAGAASIAEAKDAGLRADGGDAGEVLDAESRAAYKRRLIDLRDELDEARGFNDVERAARIEREISFLADELSRGVGLGGRSRRAASHAERARVNVTRTVAAVLKKVAAECPALGQYLNATVRTGLFCAYTPDPRVPLTWEL